MLSLVMFMTCCHLLCSYHVVTCYVLVMLSLVMFMTYCHLLCSYHVVTCYVLVMLSFVNVHDMLSLVIKQYGDTS